MPKDYVKNKKRAKPRTTNKKQKKKVKKQRSRWLIPATLALTVAFVSGLVMLKLKHHQQQQANGAPLVDHSQQYVIPLSDQQANKTAAQLAPAAQTSQHSTEPEFEFYQELSKNEEADNGAPVEQAQPTLIEQQPTATTAQTSTQTTAKQTAAATIKPKATKGYYIQVASFHHYQDADNFKGKLLLTGYQPSIEKKLVAGKTWFRVTLGPYPKRTAALTALKQLKKQGFQGLISQKT